MSVITVNCFLGTPDQIIASLIMQSFFSQQATDQQSKFTIPHKLPHKPIFRDVSKSPPLNVPRVTVGFADPPDRWNTCGTPLGTPINACMKPLAHLHTQNHKNPCDFFIHLSSIYNILLLNIYINYICIYKLRLII